MESILVFEINNKPIPRIDTPTSVGIRFNTWGASIAFSGIKSSKNKKCLASANFSKKKFNTETTIILADSFKKSAAKLGNVFFASKS